MKRPRTGATVFLLSAELLTLARAPISAASVAAATAVDYRFQSRAAYSSDRRWYIEVLQVDVSENESAPLAEEDDPVRDLDSSEDTPADEARHFSQVAPEAREKPRRPFLLVSVYALDRPSEPTRVSTFRLQEERLPNRVLISDDGESVVLLGEGSRGSRMWDAGALEAVVLHRWDGSRVRSLSLADLLTSGDLLEVRSHGSAANSLWTSTEIDESRGVLTLQLDRRLPEEDATEERLATLEVDLETGRPLQPKRDLLLQPRAIHSNVADGLPYTATAYLDDDPTCSPSWVAALSTGSVLKASNAELRAHALAAPRPAYTELGRKARVTGTVVVELRLSERGEVEGVCLVKGLPMGLDRMALLAARRWTFQPFEVEGKRVRAVGRLAFEFGWFLAEAETADAPYSSRK